LFVSASVPNSTTPVFFSFLSDLPAGCGSATKFFPNDEVAGLCFQQQQQQQLLDH
jgi:hypothetical protein